MTINGYIATVYKEASACEDHDKKDILLAKLAYARAYKNGADALKRFRDRAITAEICKKYDRDAQLAILFNKDTHPDEYGIYQIYRAECKATVDERIEAMRREISALLEEV